MARYESGLFRSTLNMLEVSELTLARLLKVSEREVREWKEKISKPKTEIEVTMCRLFTLFEKFPSPLKGCLVNWLERPSIRLNNQRPIDLLRYDKKKEDISGPKGSSTVHNMVEKIREELKTFSSEIFCKHGFELKF